MRRQNISSHRFRFVVLNGARAHFQPALLFWFGWPQFYQRNQRSRRHLQNV